MVRTMSYLRSLIGTARRLRPRPQPAAGLPFDNEVLLDVPDERLAPALVAAANGEYEPAAKLLATTRDAAEWEDRDRYTARLAAFTLSREDWLSDWLAAAPTTRTPGCSRPSSRCSRPGTRPRAPSGCGRSVR